MTEMEEYLKTAHEKKASDVHLVKGLPVTLRRYSKIEPLGSVPLDDAKLRSLVEEVVSKVDMERLESDREIDLAITVPGVCRCRVAVFYQMDSISASFRLIPNSLPDPSNLGLPAAVNYFANMPNGLVLVTGVTGSGKSTTMSILVDQINRQRRGRIITIEDPVEYVHTSKKCVVLQREVRQDTHSYARALRAALRQDPDVIVIGEMRDIETISTALTAAETGHLVVSTLHTKTAAETIQRVVDAFPGDQQNHVQAQLAETLRGVICQRLLPLVDGSGVALAFEVLVATHPIKTLIRDKKIEQLPNSMVTGKQIGMCPLDHCLRYLLDSGQISYDVAVTNCNDPETFDQLNDLNPPMFYTADV